MGSPNPYDPTPNSVRFATAAAAKFPWFRDSRYNCRKMAGSQYWSQHAESNADDVHSGIGRIDIEKAQGDALVAWLLETVQTTGGEMKRYEAYGIRTILWWEKSVLTGNSVAGHKDHVHVDYNPRMANWPDYVPPCKSGNPDSLLVVYPGGGTAKTWALWPNVTITTEEEEDDMIAYRPGDTGAHVGILQAALNAWWRNAPTDKKPFPALLATDSVYGSTTEAAVKAYQKASGTPKRHTDVEGIDQGTWALILDRWYADRLVAEHGNEAHTPDFAVTGTGGTDLGPLTARIAKVEAFKARVTEAVPDA